MLDFTARIEEHTGASRITGTLDGWRRDPGENSNQLDMPRLPVTFSGKVSSGTFVLDSIAGQALGMVPDCENPVLNQVGTLRRNLVIVPAHLATGATWSDSSTVAMCSGAVPVQHTSIRIYTVLGEDAIAGNGAILVQRAEKITAVGEGAQGQHRIGLRVTGTGSARMLLEPSTGLLRLSEGESRTEITIRSSGREQHFIQSARERTTRTK